MIQKMLVPDKAANDGPNPGGGGIGIGFDWCPSDYGTTGPDAGKRYFAGGGQGGEDSPGSGGYGGGGDVPGENGTPNTGGGGASGNDPSPTPGGTGGPGIIIVRYLID